MKLIKVPSGAGSMKHNLGSAKAPDAIIKGMYDLFLSEDGKYSEPIIDEVKIEPSNLEETQKNIYEKIKSINEHAIILGGDHSITYASFKAFEENNPGAGILIFDAHPDCENLFQPPTHEDYLMTLIEEGILDPSKVIIVGLRNWHSNELEFLEQKNIRYYTMKYIFERGTVDVCDTIMGLARQWPALYVSIDIDAVDPAFAPGTGYIEPAGLTSRELIYMIQRLKFLKNLKMVDIVEINPEKDVNEMTVKLGSKIVRELI